MEDFQIYITGKCGFSGILSFISDVVFQGYFFKNPAFISFFHRYTGFCISPDFVGILVGAR